MATEKIDVRTVDIAQVIIADEVNIGKYSAMKRANTRQCFERLHRSSSVLWVDTKLAHSSRYISRI